MCQVIHSNLGNWYYMLVTIVPSQDDIEKMIIDRKKQELLNKYASDTLVQQEVEARTLLGL